MAKKSSSKKSGLKHSTDATGKDEAKRAPHPFGTRFLVSYDPKQISEESVIGSLERMGSHIVETSPEEIEMVLPPGQEDALTRMAASGDVKVRPAGVHLDPSEWQGLVEPCE